MAWLPLISVTMIKKTLDSRLDVAVIDGLSLWK